MIPAQLNTAVNLVVAYTLAGVAGSVDPTTPPVWTLTPDANGTITVAADGLTAQVTMTTLGDSTISVTADANLGIGVINLVVSDTITVLETANIGADAGTITVVA